MAKTLTKLVLNLAIIIALAGCGKRSEFGPRIYYNPDTFPKGDSVSYLYKYSEDSLSYGILREEFKDKSKIKTSVYLYDKKDSCVRKFEDVFYFYSVSGTSRKEVDFSSNGEGIDAIGDVRLRDITLWRDKEGNHILTQSTSGYYTPF